MVSREAIIFHSIRNLAGVRSANQPIHSFEKLRALTSKLQAFLPSYLCRIKHRRNPAMRHSKGRAEAVGFTY